MKSSDSLNQDIRKFDWRFNDNMWGWLIGALLLLALVAWGASRSRPEISSRDDVPGEGLEVVPGPRNAPAPEPAPLP